MFCSSSVRPNWRSFDVLTNSFQIIVASLLAAVARAAPLVDRADTTTVSVVQGLLGSDGYWNDFDGQHFLGNEKEHD